MDESLKNQVIDTLEDMYLKELKNKYTVFLVVTLCDLLKHIFDRYGNIATSDLESNNKWINKPVYSSLPINKYFNQINDCVQFDNDGKTPYTEEQVVQNAHHVVLVSGI